MAEIDMAESRLGEALTTLGLEDKFLSNGELQKFPLVQRGALARGIIDEKLRLGRWHGVVEMMFGGLGKADALYEGDMDQLRDRIAQASAQSEEGVTDEIIRTLRKKEEYDLILRLIETHPKVSLKGLEAIRSHLPSEFFKEEAGQQRMRRIEELGAAKAMVDGDYRSALYYYQRLENVSGIDTASDLVLDKSDIHYPEEYAEQIALRDPKQSDARLKKIVLSHSREGGLGPVSAFKMFKKHKVALSPKEQTALYESVAEKADRLAFERTRELNEDHAFLLLWAKKHAEKDPRAAFNIFNLNKYDGPEVAQAAKAGLAIKGYKEYERVHALDVDEIPEPTLRAIYQESQFDVQVRIATHLKDSGLLQTLSRQASEKREYLNAYRLWLSSGESMDSDYPIGLKSKLIDDGLKNHFGSINLDKTDITGNRLAFEALMQTSQGSNEFLSRAYDTAREIGDEALTQRAREAMVAVNPGWALRHFRGFRTGKITDPVGVDYVASVVAKQANVDPAQLRGILGKYESEY